MNEKVDMKRGCERRSFSFLQLWNGKITTLYTVYIKVQILYFCMMGTLREKGDKL
jgi:hypothetical protein